MPLERDNVLRGEVGPVIYILNSKVRSIHDHFDPKIRRLHGLHNMYSECIYKDSRNRC